MGEAGLRGNDTRGDDEHGGGSWNLPDQLPADDRNAALLAEGAVQLVVTLVGLTLIVLRIVSHAGGAPVADVRPTQPAASTATAHRRQVRAFHLDHSRAHRPGSRQRPCVLSELPVRVSICTPSYSGSDELRDFDSLVVRVLSNFFGLKLGGATFIRWALSYHKWAVLIPTFLFFWFFLALCFSQAEVKNLSTSMWFIIVSMSEAPDRTSSPPAGAAVPRARRAGAGPSRCSPRRGSSWGTATCFEGKPSPAACPSCRRRRTGCDFRGRPSRTTSRR